MSYRTPITDSDLHAYVDGELPPTRRQEVEAYLRVNPEAASRVADYERINRSLSAAFDPVLLEPLPEQLRVPQRQPRQLLRVAAAAAWLALGGMIGWSLHPTAGSMSDVGNPLQADLAGPAVFAHAIFATEVRHPVEVGADQQTHLLTWLSHRLKTRLQAPDLSGLGYRLVGGRLLPSTNRMAAQLMYEQAQGRRVTLYIRRGEWPNAITSFHYASGESGINSMYWLDASIGYALTGEVGREELEQLANSVYRQLDASAASDGVKML